LIIVSV